VPEKAKYEINEAHAVWRHYLNTGDMPDYIATPWFASKRMRPLYRYLPAEPRCQVCLYPFKGIGGKVMRGFFGIEPSRLNPHLCNHCEKFIQEYPGGAEVEVSIMFADVRGSTQMAENMGPLEFSQLINRFYRAATKVLYDTGAMVEKLIGDAVTGFYTNGFGGKEHARVAIKASQAILKATGHGQEGQPWIPVGIGVHTGVAYVGTVNADAGHNDISVLGDTANTGARLAALAEPGQVLVSQAAAEAAGLAPDTIEIQQLELKGRTEPVKVWILSSQAQTS
jgi:adenylate cyclase